MRCPRCNELAHHIQVKVDLVACVFCSKAWKFDQIGVADTIQAGIVEGGPACDRVMRAVDEASAEILGVELGIAQALQPGELVGAIAKGDTTLAEIVARFRRNLINGGVPQE